MLKGVETVVYYAEDMKAVGAWYRGVLGLEPNYDTEYYVGFTVGGDELGFHPPKEGAKPILGQRRRQTAGAASPKHAQLPDRS